MADEFAAAEKAREEMFRRESLREVFTDDGLQGCGVQLWQEAVRGG